LSGGIPATRGCRVTLAGPASPNKIAHWLGNAAAARPVQVEARQAVRYYGLFGVTHNSLL